MANAAKESDMEKTLVLRQALVLARRCRYEKQHAHQVMKLSLQIFDELSKLHQLKSHERDLLEIGALLHDIGWLYGQARHHKDGRDLIMAAKDLSVEKRERIIIALLARYHRKCLPKPSHRYFNTLKSDDRRRIMKLAAILRVADALDRSHGSLVQKCSCRILKTNVVLDIQATSPLTQEIPIVQKKSDLFRQVFKRDLILKTHGQ